MEGTVRKKYPQGESDMGNEEAPSRLEIEQISSSNLDISDNVINPFKVNTIPDIVLGDGDHSKLLIYLS